MRTLTLIAVLSLAWTADGVAAAGRFRPAADYVVLTVPTRASDDPLIAFERRWKAAPQNPAFTQELAEAYVQRARTTGDARFFGRAEQLLSRWVNRADAPAPLLHLQADILQNRHEFRPALALLNRAVLKDPSHVQSRLTRAAVLTVQGRAAEARADCTAVLAAGESAAGTICLAQILGATGPLQRARDLLRALIERDLPLAPGLHVWALLALADLADRQGDTSGAEQYVRAALEKKPHDELALTTLVDLLLARGAAREALQLLREARASVGLLVRQAQAQRLINDRGLELTLRQLDELLSVSARRGERPHLREEALLALEVMNDVPRALALAKANFELQRETVDVRLLAHAARAARDPASLKEVEQWKGQTGFEDARS